MKIVLHLIGSRQKSIKAQPLYKIAIDIVLAGVKLTDSHYLVSLDKKHIVKNATRKKVEGMQITLPKELLPKLRENFK